MALFISQPLLGQIDRNLYRSIYRSCSISTAKISFLSIIVHEQCSKQCHFFFFFMCFYDGSTFVAFLSSFFSSLKAKSKRCLINFLISFLNALSTYNLIFTLAIVISQKFDILSVVPENVKKSVPPPFESTVKPITALSQTFLHKKIHQFGHYRVLKTAS
jgi:hypothetical protein